MNFPHKKIMPRYFLWTFLLVLAGLAVVCKAFYTMTVKRDDWMKMSRMQVRDGRPLPAKRGNILAADGQVLAASLPEYTMSIDFMSSEKDSAMRVKDQYRRDTTLYNNMDSIVQGIHAIFPDIDPARLKAHLFEGRRLKKRNWPIYVNGVTSLKLRRRENKQITYVQYSEVKKLPLFRLRSSANFQKIEMRRRPFGNLALRTVGDFRDTARYGLEESFDSILAGHPGTYHFRKVMNRRVIEIDTPAIDGCDIQTTIDVAMQEVCETALGEKLNEIDAKAGVCILMEVETGDIKAMTSLIRQGDGTYFEDHAMAVTDIYQPGSVFKPQSFLVALDEGKIKMTDIVDTGHGTHKFGSYTMKDHNIGSGGYGVIAVPQIIGCSSNIGVSVLIDNAYGDNPRQFIDGIYRIGSAEDLRIPLPGYHKPRVRYPGPNYYWSRSSLPLMSIGYETEFAPINTLNFYNGIANNGKLLRPRLVKAILRDGQVVKEFPVEVLREQMAKPEAVKGVRECLEYVTTRGVGKKAASKLFSTAGKTGTAQVWGGGGRTRDYFVTFAGYFPADKPRYSCIVCILNTGTSSGGGMCGPVFRRVAETVMARNHVSDYSSARDTLRIPTPTPCNGNITATSRLLSQVGVSFTAPTTPTRVDALWGYMAANDKQVSLTQADEAADVVPNVHGYGLRDAVNRLERLGLKVRTSGAGYVTAQSIAAGTKLHRGQTIHLTLGREGRKRKP